LSARARPVSVFQMLSAARSMVRLLQILEL
jgi:hypothetical protein